MQSTNSEAQVTQEGQAIAINNITCEELIELFAPMLGPNGSLKALVNGAQEVSLTKDGNTVCKEVPFTHPTAILITRAAASLYQATGDGITSFILMCADTFKQSYKYYIDGVSVPLIINSLQLALQDAMNIVQQNVLPLTDEHLKKLAVCSLKTKIRHPEFLADILIKALVAVSKSKRKDIDMVEVISMEGGDIRDSVFVDGLVLDHAGRHYAMPKVLSNVCILITNLSLEYEKPEINAEFCYSSPEQREALAETEREFIANKARAIADFARELRKENKTLLMVNEKGIDPFSLEILNEAGVLGLRRAKRRNLERLFNMCGGKIITQISQLNRDCLGYCERVSVHTIGENKYTFVEGTPVKGSCTILVRGSSDASRLNKSIKGTLQSLFLAVESKCCLLGGTGLYKKLMNGLSEKMAHVNSLDMVGYKILSNVFENMIKVLMRNSGAEIFKTLSELHSSRSTEDVVENARVVGSVINNSVITAINLLMCDEIIKAGKPIKQDKIENN
ncbi:T-complex protein 1 subunit zeta [Enteropsectra breve]|nr:T-complex protein 1 subunit zeta [Enteropsectra breve]